MSSIMLPPMNFEVKKIPYQVPTLFFYQTGEERDKKLMTQKFCDILRNRRKDSARLVWIEGMQIEDILKTFVHDTGSLFCMHFCNILCKTGKDTDRFY